MDYAEILNGLMELDVIERLGKLHQQTRGGPLSLWQYVYLLYSESVPDDAELLYTDGSLTAQRKVEEDFHRRFGASGLAAQDFLTEGRNLGIEKLPRYVSISAHKHEFVEMAYVLYGSCTHTVSGLSFTQTKGDLVFVPSGAVHELAANGEALCLTLKLRSEFFRALDLPGMLHFVAPLLLRCGSDDFIRVCFLTLFREQAQKTAYCDPISEHLAEAMLTYVMERYSDTIQFLLAGPVQEQDVLCIHLLNYIAENYRTVTLTSLAGQFHFNPTYLSTLLKQRYGLRFSDVLRDYRLRMAEKYLCDTDMKLNDICDAIGYKDTTQFIRAFKERFGMTPAKYRKEKQS